MSTGTIKHSKNRMHRVLKLEPEQTNNVYADHAIDTGKQISSADSSNLPPDSSDSSAIGLSNRISQSVFSLWVQLCRQTTVSTASTENVPKVKQKKSRKFSLTTIYH